MTDEERAVVKRIAYQLKMLPSRCTLIDNPNESNARRVLNICWSDAYAAGVELEALLDRNIDSVV